MRSFIAEHYFLNRTAVSEDTDKLAFAIRDLVEADLFEIPAGQECLTWFIPKHWKVRQAYLARLDGTVVVDFQNHPLHLWTHSISVQGEISREDLEPHLFTDPHRPSCIPYHYRNGYRFDAADWGFSLAYETYLSLTEAKYFVCIDSDLDTKGTLKIVDKWLKGAREETVFFAAHTCHPGQVTDGLSNIAVLIHFFRMLMAQKNWRYSYRLIAGPEYFGAAGFLASVPEREIQLLKGGLYLDLIGNNRPFGYQTSFQTNTLIDRVVANVFDHYVPGHLKQSYRKLIGNDEMFYNGPGFLIPTLGFAAVENPEYHSDQDNLNLLNPNQLDEAVTILLRIVQTLEEDYIPVPQFRGPLYLSRYQLYIDPNVNPKDYDALEYVQILMDGTRSCFDIADQLGLSFFFVKNFCDQLLDRHLVSKEEKRHFG